MVSLELITNLKLIDGSARTTVPTPEELPLGYMCFGIVNSRASIWGNYDGSVHDLVEEGGGDLNIENGTGTGSIQQKGITYNKLITDYEPNMVAYVSYIGAGVSSPTSEQLIALLNSDKTNPYVAQILGNYTFEQYCVGFLAGIGAIQSGISNKTAIDSLIAGALEGYGLTSSSDLSNIIGKVGSAAAILGAMNKAFSPGAFAGGVGCEAGDEGYPGNSVCSFAFGSNVKTKGICSVGIGRDLENLGDTSAVFGRGNKEYKIEGSELEKISQRRYLNNLAEAGGTVNGTGDDRVGVTGINKGANNFMAGNSHYIGDDAYNNTVLGNQNIIGKVDADGNCANNLISGLNNYIGQSNGCGIIGYDNKIRNSVNTILLGNGLEAQGAYYAVGVGRFNAINSNAWFFVGNGASDSDRKNAFEVLGDGRAKVQSAPVDDDDVVRKGDLSGVGGGTKLYKHRITIDFPIGSGIMFIYVTGLLSHNTIINTIDLLVENSTLLENIANVSYMGPQGKGGGVLTFVRYNNPDAVYEIMYDFGGTFSSLSLANFTSITDTITEI